MKNFIFLPLFIFLLGCESKLDFDFERPEVVAVSPAHNSTLVPAGSRVTVDFSKPMDTIKTNNEFSLNSDSGKVEGVFAWENGGTKLIFTPRENLSMSDKFTIRVKKGAEDADGNDLKEEFVSMFFINGENGSPYITSYTPLADSIANLPGSQIVITFTEPVDLNSIYNSISISPSIQGRFTWNAGVADSTVITFIPLYAFDYGTTYTVTVSDSILDVSGNRLREPVTFNFTVGDDFIKPELAVSQDLAQAPLLNFAEALITHGAEKNNRLVLRFTEIISTDNLRSAISISPSAGFYVSSEVLAGATTAYINFTDKLVSEEIYTLRVNSSITDVQGNPLVRDYRYVFVTDGVNSIAPVVSGIGDLLPFLYWTKGDIQPLAQQIANPLSYPDIIVDFTSGNIGPLVEIDPLSLSMYIELVAGTGAGGSIINIDWPNGPPAKFTRLKFGLYGIGAGNIYKIVIKGGKSGLKDMRGNYMKQDFVQMIMF